MGSVDGVDGCRRCFCLGYSLAELSGTDTKFSRAPSAAKYRHPENPSLTWSGKRRKPQWFIDVLAVGKNAEDLTV